MNQVFLSQTGRVHGRDIVQEGAETPSIAWLYGEKPGVVTIRWTFSDVEADAFRWRSERSADGVNWQLQREYRGRRVK
jgi:hypothetical protein